MFPDHFGYSMKNRTSALFLLLLTLFFFLHPQPVCSKPSRAAIVSAHPLATLAGQEILKKGGNAFDAAIAVSSTLGVVEPFGSGIGGGGFWLIYHSETDKYHVLDAREKAPLAATKDMYLDNNGNVIKGLSTSGALSAAIPGIPAVWYETSSQFGLLPLQDVMEFAIDKARTGFPVDERYISGARYKLLDLKKNKEAASIFLHDNEVPEVGWILRQKDLAQTLLSVAKKGKSGFYEGAIAKSMVEDVQRHGGIWSLEDLMQYSVIERSPVFIKYKNAQIIAPPLPSSGGLVLTNILNILSGYDLDRLTPLDRKHLIIEAMRHGYHNRAIYMGDSDYVSVPTQAIVSSAMAERQRSLISIEKATSSAALPISKHNEEKGTETTHFSIIDAQGNMVSATQSINFWFGSGVVARGTGVLLNNQMDDFTVKVGSANGYGLVGVEANAISPEKRMLSSMTPIIAHTKDNAAILGTPGGSRIISMNLLALMSFLDNPDSKNILSTPRYHHQYLPDKVIYEENAFTENELTGLKNKGHILEKSRNFGNMPLIILNKKTGAVETYSDPRGMGAGRVY